MVQEATVVQDVTTYDRDIVTGVRAALADRVGRQRAARWFGGHVRLLLEDRRLVVEVASEFFLEWLRLNFRSDVEAAVAAVVGAPWTVEFRVATGDLPAESADAASASSGEFAVGSTVGASVIDDLLPASEPVRKVDSAAPVGGRVRSRDTAVRDTALPPDGPLPPGPSEVADRSASASRRTRPLSELSGFVVGACNRLAYASAEMAIRELGSCSPLYFHGGTGVGKTHLLEGICAAAGRLRPRVRTVYRTAEQFTSDFLESLHHSGLPSFRRKYRDVDVLVLDDIHFFGGKRATLVEVLHTLDALLRSGRQVVLAADRPAAELDALGPELTARLNGGMACRVAAPDFDVRLGIVRQLAQRLRIELPQEVEALVAARFSEHARELSGAICRLKAASEAHGQPITRDMADAALADLAPHVSRGVQLADIEQAVCDVLGLQVQSLRSDRKARALSHPRMLAMWLARKHTRSALSEIGSYFGRRSHTTVLSAQKRVERWMIASRQASGDPHWNVTDTIRRVEERLRVG